LAILERKREDSAATINRLLGHRPMAPLTAPTPFEPRLLPLDEPKLWGLALEARPAIRAAQHDLARGDAAIKLAERNKRYPDIEMGGMVTHYTGDRDFRMAELQVAIPLPWWNRKKYDAEVHRERANRSAVEQDLVNLRNATMEEVHHFVTQAETARRLVELYRGGVLTQARLNVDASRASYQTGQSDFLTLLSAQRTLLSTQLDYHRAMADHEKALAEIERMIGQPLEPVAPRPAPKLIAP
jgi:outer membrane protein TolC